MAYFIFLTGKLLETIYYQPDASLSYIAKTVFYMVSVSLFVVILWRHYQKD